jgi:ArsR family metal-binding transcriptional regulator
MLKSEDYGFEEEKQDENKKVIKYYLTILHFNDQYASSSNTYGTGIVDLRLVKKVIEAKEKDEEVIHEIQEEIEMRIR